MNETNARCFINIICGRKNEKCFFSNFNDFEKLCPSIKLIETFNSPITIYINGNNNEKFDFYEIELSQINLFDNKEALSYYDHALRFRKLFNVEQISLCEQAKITFLKDYSKVQKEPEALLDLQNNIFDNIIHSNQLISSRVGRNLQVFRSDKNFYSKNNNNNKLPRCIAVGLILNKKKDKVLLIERSKKKGLIFPKGGCDIDEWPLAGVSAMRETWEESGAICKLERELYNKIDINSYTENKSNKNHSFSIFQMYLIEMKDDWPEKKKRAQKRFWLSYKEAVANFSDRSNFDNNLSKLYLMLLNKSDLKR
ncbi:hypothetical protein QEN19_001383 [Hanseniaspora menglaensis]